MPKEKTPFVDWFDVNNKDHLEAYLHISKAGHWPEHFVPADVEMTVNWNVEIAYKMAMAWCQIKTHSGVREGGLQERRAFGTDDTKPILLEFGGQDRE